MESYRPAVRFVFLIIGATDVQRMASEMMAFLLNLHVTVVKTENDVVCADCDQRIQWS